MFKSQLKLEISNAKYKETTEKKREKVFEEGDMVMEYLRRDRIHVGSYNKMKRKKYEPFKTVKKISDNAYIVDLPSNMAMSRTFNVADLCKCHPTEQLFQDYNSRMSSLKEGGTIVEDQPKQATWD